MIGYTALAALVSATGAFREAMPEGTRVFTAPVDPVEDLLREGAPAPVIAVYVGHSTRRIEGRRIQRGAGRIDLRVQIFLPERMDFRLSAVSAVLDTRGLGAPIGFAGLWHLCKYALTEGTGTWSRIWADIVEDIPEETSEPYLVEVGEIRYAACEIVLTCTTGFEPPFGEPPSGVWADLIEALRTASDYGPEVADLLARQIGANGGLPSWRIEQMAAGLAPDEALALGLGALPGGEAEPPVTRLTVETPRGPIVVEAEPAP